MRKGVGGGGGEFPKRQKEAFRKRYFDIKK